MLRSSSTPRLGFSDVGPVALSGFRRRALGEWVRRWLWGGVVGLGCFACSSGDGQDGAAPPQQPLPVVDACANVPSFETELYPSLQERCSACHAAGKPHVLQFSLSEADVRERRFDIRTLLKAGKMPPPAEAAPLAPATVTKFVTWVDCGAP